MVHLPTAREPEAAKLSQSCPSWLVLGARAWLPDQVRTAQWDLTVGLPALPPGYKGWLLTPGERKGRWQLITCPTAYRHPCLPHGNHFSCPYWHFCVFLSSLCSLDTLLATCLSTHSQSGLAQCGELSQFPTFSTAKPRGWEDYTADTPLSPRLDSLCFQHVSCLPFWVQLPIAQHFWKFHYVPFNEPVQISGKCTVAEWSGDGQTQTLNRCGCNNCSQPQIWPWWCPAQIVPWAIWIWCGVYYGMHSSTILGSHAWCCTVKEMSDPSPTFCEGDG